MIGISNRHLLCALVFLFSFPLLAYSGSSKNVLLLNSYHQGFKWTDEELASIVTELDKTGISLKYYVEYMGTKWVYNKEYLERLPDIYRLKFKSVSFDLIVATDDDAFSFLLKNRNSLFGKIPVVFCGVNWLDKERLQGHTGYTGVNEDAEIALNIELMLRLHPGTRNIYVVADQTTTGRIVHRKIKELSPAYKDRVAIRTLDNLSFKALLEKVSRLSDDSLVFLTIFQQDTNGRFVQFSEIAQQLSENSRVPVYGLWDFYLGYGIVGGMLTSGAAQGQSAGRLGARILAGESPDTLPTVMKSPNRYRFDYLQLKRFGINPDVLPEDSMVINSPPSFYTFTKGSVWLVTSISLLTIIIVMILAVNIHQRNRAELALRESDAKYRTLVDNLRVGVYRNSAEMDGKILQANPAMGRIFGYESPDEINRINVTDLYHDPEERRRFIDELNKTGFLSDRELLMKKKDGTPIWVLCNATAVYDKNGRLEWIDGVNEDITDRKHLEEQLRHAQKMEAIGTLAGGVAHDFNNILTAIIGFGNLLKTKVGDNEEFLHYLEPILISADKAARLTKSLLTFSRRQIINLSPVDLSEIVKSMGHLLQRVIREDIELDINCRDGRLMALADRGQVEQVLMNLVTNARDAMPKGGLLSIETDRIQLVRKLMVRHEFIRPGNYAVISVSDTGMGIDEATRARIFEPFFSSKEVGKGTGLGLSIVYGIVKQHNGDISVYSEPGKGTNFKVYLPLIDDTVKEKAKTRAEETAKGGDETILIGEDNNEVRSLAEEILSLAGYTVLSAVDGDDVLDKFQTGIDRVDLLLLDVVMPKKNGKEVYDLVSRVRPDIKVLFMSGYTANIIHKQGVLNEGINFIAKPLSPDLLLAKVRQVLSSRTVAQDGET